MKLKDWADKTGIKYLTAYRWFKSGTLPVKAIQTNSGTIIVEEELEDEKQNRKNMNSSNISLFLKKTVEFSKDNASIEDFAAWVLSNFSIQSLDNIEKPQYSRVKPKSEEVQNHFKQFLRPKGEKPKPNMFVAEPGAFDDLMSKADSLTTQELVDEIQKIGVNGGVSINPSDVPEVEDLFKDLSSVISSPNQNTLSVTSYVDIAEGVVQRSVDLTPQQFNYTNSTNSAFSNYSAPNTNVGNTMFVSNVTSVSPFAEFQPTQKELQSMARVSEIVDKPKRGRKPSRNSGKK